MRVMESDRTAGSVSAAIEGQVMTKIDSLLKNDANSDEEINTDKVRKTAAALLKTEVGPDKIRGIMLQVYRETYTQEEVDALIAFYSSPVGASVIKKVALVDEKSRKLVQAETIAVFEKIVAAVRGFSPKRKR